MIQKARVTIFLRNYFYVYDGKHENVGTKRKTKITSVDKLNQASLRLFSVSRNSKHFAIFSIFVSFTPCEHFQMRMPFKSNLIEMFISTQPIIFSSPPRPRPLISIPLEACCSHSLIFRRFAHNQIFLQTFFPMVRSSLLRTSRTLRHWASLVR